MMNFPNEPRPHPAALGISDVHFMSKRLRVQKQSEFVGGNGQVNQNNTLNLVLSTEAQTYLCTKLYVQSMIER